MSIQTLLLNYCQPLQQNPFKTIKNRWSLVPLIDALCATLATWIQRLHIKQFEDQWDITINPTELNPTLEIIMRLLGWRQYSDELNNRVYLDVEKYSNHHELSRGVNIWRTDFQFNDNNKPVLDWTEQNIREQHFANRF